jgi:hypothetical protein
MNEETKVAFLLNHPNHDRPGELLIGPFSYTPLAQKNVELIGGDHGVAVLWRRLAN